MKTLNISPKETLAEVKNEFSSLFPNLKIEFFEQNHAEGQGNTVADLITNLNITLKDAAKVNSEFNISVDGHKKVSTLEQDFEALGLNVQLFRKSGQVWLQTTTSDHWTLAEQNKEAEATL